MREITRVKARLVAPLEYMIKRDLSKREKILLKKIGGLIERGGYYILRLDIGWKKINENKWERKVDNFYVVVEYKGQDAVFKFYEEGSEGEEKTVTLEKILKAFELVIRESIDDYGHPLEGEPDHPDSYIKIGARAGKEAILIEKDYATYELEYFLNILEKKLVVKFDKKNDPCYFVVFPLRGDERMNVLKGYEKVLDWIQKETGMEKEEIVKAGIDIIFENLIRYHEAVVRRIKKYGGDWRDPEFRKKVISDVLDHFRVSTETIKEIMRRAGEVDKEGVPNE